MQILAIHGVLGFSNESWLSKGSIKGSLAASMRALESPSPRGDGAHTDDAHVEHLQSVAAQLLLQDHAQDAEEWFARCNKASASAGRQSQHYRSCLIAGLMGLHRHQLRSAWTGLQHALDAKQAPVSVVVQSHAALAAMYFNLGMRRPAMAALELALDKLVPVTAYPLPLAVLTLMKTEFIVLDLLRQHERLLDLAFWPRHEEVAGNRISLEDAWALLASCRRSMRGHAFLESRVEFLEALLRMAYGHSTEVDAPLAYVQSLQAEGLTIHAHAARHELALACIASQRHQVLRQLMHAYAASSRRDAYLRNSSEHEYCLAKLGELSGDDKQYITHYREYASKSLVHLRQTCAYITVPTMVRQAATEIPKDDVASRLSGRYRRAYQFILSHLHRDDLSIRQVAQEVGVTERSLQLAFAAALGQSPSAVIRQCRMDRIRDELGNGAVGHGTTTLDVGMRWGLRSRSAMSQAYKKQFGELPSQAGGMGLVPLPANVYSPMMQPGA